MRQHEARSDDKSLRVVDCAFLLVPPLELLALGDSAGGARVAVAAVVAVTAGSPPILVGWWGRSWSDGAPDG